MEKGQKAIKESIQKLAIKYTMEDTKGEKTARNKEAREISKEKDSRLISVLTMETNLKGPWQGRDVIRFAFSKTILTLCVE